MIIKVSFLFFIILLFINPVYSDDTRDSIWNTGKDDLRYLKGKNSNYKRGRDALNQAKKYYKKGKANKAKRRINDSIKFFTLANEKYPQDPDILNYLAYTLKIVDDYIMAEIYYTQGLEINPKHVDINKNLGKLYVEINQISKAKERLAALKNCNCIEFDELRSLIQKN